MKKKILEDGHMIEQHRWSPNPDRKGKIDVLIKWDGYEEPTWEPVEVIKKDDSIALAKYADEKGLTDQVKWNWAKSYTRSRKVLLRRDCNILKAKKKKKKGGSAESNINLEREHHGILKGYMNSSSIMETIYRFSQLNKR